MKKVLIVDDNKNNRMILSLLLEDYVEENNIDDFDVSEAENGQIAVDMCTKTSYDLVFMDIMMPIMDGIEATALIRKSSPKSMIIAVSAVDDADRQKSILSNGAEDYISKPVNADIFNSRIANYISLIDSRSHKHENKLSSNSFTTEIYSRQLIFQIQHEDALSEFWEYYLLDEDEKYDNLSDVVRTIYSMADLELKLGIKPNIVIEESEKDIFFTLTGLDTMDKKIIQLVLLKNKLSVEHKQTEEQISFSLPKVVTAEKIEEPVVLEPVVATPSEVIASPVVNTEYKKSEETLEVYSYMEDEDLDEMEDYVNRLSSLLMVVGRSDIEESEVHDISIYLGKIAKYLTLYSESYNIGQSLQEFSQNIADHIGEFQSMSADIGPMCAAFSSDMTTWIKMTFHTGAPSVKFMDDTFIANVQTICSMLNMNNDSGEEESLDDIFDF